MDDFTHDDLCLVGQRFLLSRRAGRSPCSFAVVEPTTGARSTPDVIGWGCHGQCHQVEVKRSRSDFFADRHKISRRGDAVLGTHRWYLTPKGLVVPADLPEGWGLVYAYRNVKGRVCTTVVHEAPRVEPSRLAAADERVVVASLLRRFRDGGSLNPETGRISTYRDILAAKEEGQSGA